MPHLRQKFVVALTIFLAFAPAFPIEAQSVPTSTAPAKDVGFDPEAVLNDSDILELADMNLLRIQEFLSQRGTLGRYRTLDIDGKEKPASEIIWRVATSYKINPKYLMALMQKEQSLVEALNPTQKQFDWATGFGICDDCSMNDPRLQDYKGFANQLEWAAKQHRERYLLQILGKGKTIAGQAPGKTMLIDGKPLTPVNQATAMLYSYTPHVSGNLNLWRIWQRWYGLTFPDGTVVQGKTSKKAYLIRFGQKLLFKTPTVLASMADMSKIVLAEDSQLTAYPDGRTISLPNYALVETPDKKVYLLAGDKKRQIIGHAAFVKNGFNADEVLDATFADIADYTDGSDITTKTVYAMGALDKDPKKVYWYVEDGVRHRLPDRSFVKLYFNGAAAKAITQKKLDTLVIGDPYKLRDGELVRGAKDPAVYVISSGTRLPIPSGDVFEELGWKWNNVVTLPDSVLNDYPIGNMIDPHAPTDVQLANSDLTDATSTSSTSLMVVLP